ncbi:hypothetical protein EJI01_00545 [Variovorax sp. MHTC-1]|nr:hypothetical protein EJI01_00545 [Variovorax sp. MHTC-1]
MRSNGRHGARASAGSTLGSQVSNRGCFQVLACPCRHRFAGGRCGLCEQRFFTSAHAHLKHREVPPLG